MFTPTVPVYTHCISPKMGVGGVLDHQWGVGVPDRQLGDIILISFQRIL